MHKNTPKNENKQPPQKKYRAYARKKSPKRAFALTREKNIIFLA